MFASLGGCIVAPGPPPAGYAEVDFVDASGYHHRGWYDNHHVWHGGYYDASHHYHSDPGNWHR